MNNFFEHKKKIEKTYLFGIWGKTFELLEIEEL